MQVALEIRKALYRDYLNYLFSRDQEGRYIVTRGNDFGKLLCSRVQYSQLPVKKGQPGEKTIVLLLPSSRPLANARNHYLFYTKEDQEKIQDLLEVVFNIDFDRFYLQGCKMQMMQKDIIQSFIVTRKLVNLIGDNETLKKRQYRDELVTLKNLTSSLLKKADYRNSLITNSLKTAINL